MSLFQKSVTNKYLKNQDTEKVDKAFENFQKFYGDKLRLANIMQLKEENYQEGFLREIFVETLGFTINPDKDFNLTTEFKNQKDARKADGAILKDGKAIGVIELKSTKTKNLESIKEQAFGYKNNQPNCKYVITSNFQSLRFYVDNATEYEEFNLFHLDKNQFKLLYLLLSKESIFSDLPEKLKQETKFHENNISTQLYEDYKHFKDKIFENLVKNNPQYDKLTLFKKSQKLLDRFLFIFFAEDSGLIPPNAVSKIVEQWKTLQELDEYKPLYSRFKKLFSHLDKGHVYKKWGEIPAYNGGLFRNDEILDTDQIKIDDEILEKDSLKLSKYDFNTEVDVNILGHIFEHSLNEIEEITAELHGENIDKKKSKRKKDGVFYTPKYITKYIVENTVGILCNEKKAELQINNLLIDNTFRKKNGKVNQKGKQLFDTLNNYKNWLISLKILDPACGSGAFLNQTLDFLIVEHKQIDDLIAELTGEALRLHDTDKSILENNIYGVDINEESVEIAKLSLWLRTAQRGRPLSDLSGNIKCGNSLIDDPEVAGNKAFDWEKEFPHVFNPKIKEKVYQKLPETKPDYVKLVKEKSKKAQQKAEQAAKLSKEAMEISKQVFEYAEKITRVNESSVPYGIKKGGFDVVLGNPPYVTKNFTSNQKLYFNSNYLTAQYQLDLYVSFIEKGINVLKPKGIISYIVPNSWLKNLMFDKCRKYILEKTKIEIIIPNLENIFIEASVDTMIFVGVKSSEFNPKIQIGAFNKTDYYSKHTVDQNRFFINDRHIFDVEISKEAVSIFEKVKKQSICLSEISDITRGINPYDKYRGQSEEIIKNKLYHSDYKKDETFVPEIRGKHVNRYSFDWDGCSYVSYGDWLAAPREKKFFVGDRIICRQVLGKNLNCTFIDSDFIIDQSVFIAKFDDTQSSISNPLFILTQLTSKLIGYYFRYKANEFDALFPKIKIGEYKELPVKNIENQKPFIEKADLMLLLNKQMQTEKKNFLNTLKEENNIEKITKKLDAFYNFEYDILKKELAKQKVKISLGNENNEWREYFSTTKQKINNIQNQINQIDKEIDKMVYELYELTAEEIEIVENSVK